MYPYSLFLFNFNTTSMTILNTIVFSDTQPTNTKVLWAKPDENGITLHVYKNGAWVSEKGGGSDSVGKNYIDTQDLATLTSAKKYIDTLVGDINTILDKINGEVV